MYVPLEHAMRTVAVGRPMPDVSVTLIREEADFSTPPAAPLEMTEWAPSGMTGSESLEMADETALRGDACKASASGVGQNFFDLFSGEKVLVRGGTADAESKSSNSNSEMVMRLR